MDSGLLVVRVVFGAVMAAHGAQKLFGWFGGHGLSGTAGFFEGLGFRPGRLFAGLAGLAELAGGTLLAFGFLTPLAAALIVSVMVVAAVTVHWRHGLFAAANGVELTLLYGAAAFALALSGPGALSVDAALGLTDLWTPRLGVVVAALGALGGFANLRLRRTVSPVAVA